MTSSQPKGGMCAVCSYKLNNCSKLPFNTMPVIKRDGESVIVKCAKFSKGDRL